MKLKLKLTLKLARCERRGPVGPDPQRCSNEKTELFLAAACRAKTGEHGAAVLSKAKTRHVSVGEADQRRLPEMFIRLFLRAGGRINTTIGGGVVPTQVRREKGLQTETSKDQNRLDFVRVYLRDVERLPLGVEDRRDGDVVGEEIEVVRLEVLGRARARHQLLKVLRNGGNVSGVDGGGG